jgi:hypothetical protein
MGFEPIIWHLEVVYYRTQITVHFILVDTGTCVGSGIGSVAELADDGVLGESRICYSRQ